MMRARLNRYPWRSLVSVMTALLFAALLMSGLVLLAAPDHGTGRCRWVLLGLSTLEWGAFHSTVSLLFGVACLAHCAVNWRALVRSGRRVFFS